MSVVPSMHINNDNDGKTADLDPARGVVPAIVIGAAIWVIAFAIGVLIWG